MEIKGIQTPLYKKGDDLFEFLKAHLPKLYEKDIVVVTSKILALAQKRIASLKEKERIIKKESKKIINTPWALLTLTDDGWCINAGVDESNANKELLLMPVHPFFAAERIQKKLKKHFSLHQLGILITDTKSLPLRKGTIGRALSYAGFEPLKSYIGKKDLYGRKSRFTKSNIVDALAASATLVMGEGAESIPLAVIRSAPVNFSSKKPEKLFMLPEKDIFSFLYKKPR